MTYCNLKFQSIILSMLRSSLSVGISQSWDDHCNTPLVSSPLFNNYTNNPSILTWQYPGPPTKYHQSTPDPGTITWCFDKKIFFRFFAWCSHPVSRSSPQQHQDHPDRHQDRISGLMTPSLSSPRSLIEIHIRCAFRSMHWELEGDISIHFVIIDIISTTFSSTNKSNYRELIRAMVAELF